jgi:hypothetical protein
MLETLIDISLKHYTSRKSNYNVTFTFLQQQWSMPLLEVAQTAALGRT